MKWSNLSRARDRGIVNLRGYSGKISLTLAMRKRATDYVGLFAAERRRAQFARQAEAIPR